MTKGKNVLTTGDVAKICNVAPRTVSKWFDNGQLKGYRIPGSKDRRIPLSELIRFMKAHDIPLTALAGGKIRVLIVDSNVDESLAVANTLNEKGNYEAETVSNNFDSGIVAQKFTPHVMLISMLSEDIDAMSICKSIRSSEELQTMKIIAIANQLGDSEGVALLNKGFDGFISNLSDADEVVKKIEEATAIIY